jgi:hypothetical protein
MCVRRAVPSASFSFQDEVSAPGPGEQRPAGPRDVHKWLC